MHQLTGMIIYATDKDGAKLKARELFDRLCDGHCSFDYHGLNHSASRYGTICVKADSKKGKETIARLHGHTIDNLKRALKEIRETIANFTDEEIIEEQGADGKRVGLARYYFHEVGKYEGGDIFLYDDDLSGIRDNRHLENSLNKWKCLYEDAGKPNPHAKETVWFVATDTHY